MELIIILLALSLLMFVAYRGFSVILFAPWNDYFSQCAAIRMVV